MKYFFILLLIANVAYAGWRLDRLLYGPVQPEPAPVVESLPEGVPALTLLAELAHPPAERNTDAGSVFGQGVVTTTDPVPAEAEPKPVGVNPDDQASATATTDTNPPSPGAPTTESDSAPGPDGKPAADVPEIGTAAVDTTTARVPQTDTTPAERTPATDVPAGSDAVAPVQLACVTIGPYLSPDAVAAAASRIAPLASQTLSRSEATREAKLFQVFLEPSESEEQAKQRLEELKNKGIKDYLLIRRGEMRNAIQVGTFRSQESVAKRLAELESRGYKAVVVPKTEGRSRYWLDVAYDAEHSSGQGIESRMGGGVKLSALPCDKIAAISSGP